MAAEPARIDPRITRSLEGLEGALLQLLQERPYADISVADLCEQAGVSRPTFYLHFKTKDELLLKHLDHLFDEFFTEIKQFIRQPPSDDSLLRVCEVFFLLWKRNLALFQTMQRNHIEHLALDRIEKYMGQVFADFIEHQQLKLKPDRLNLAVDIMVGNLFMLIRRWSQPGRKVSYKKLGRIYFEMINPVVNRLLFDPKFKLPQL